MFGPPSPEVTGAFCRVPYPQFARSPWYSLPDHLSWFGVRAAKNSLEAFLGSIGSSNSPHSAMRQVSPCMRGGFAYPTGHTLAPVLPLTGRTTFLRHPIACLLPVRVPRSTRSVPKDSLELQAVSIAGFSMGVLSRVRVYRPVVLRLRLSASP